MYFTLKKNLKHRKNYKQNYKNRWLINFILKNEKIDHKTKYWNYLVLNKRYKNSSSTFLKNRCIETNKSRGINRITQLSNASFKSYFSKRKITGFKKASW